MCRCVKFYGSTVLAVGCECGSVFIVFKERKDLLATLDHENIWITMKNYPEYLERVVKNVFHVWNGSERGTAFRLQVEENCFWVTAGHFAKNLQSCKLVVYCQTGMQNESTDIDDWDDTPDAIDVLRIARSEENGADIAFLDLAAYDVEGAPLEFLPTERVVGDEVLFLGFPHGITLPPGDPGKGHPFPLVKRAMISGFHSRRLFLDGITVPGHSGGPVVLLSKGELPRVIGVVGGSLTGALDPESCLPMNNQFAQLNPGIGWATDLEWAVKSLAKPQLAWKNCADLAKPQ